MEDRYMTVDEVCDFLSLSRQAVYSMRHKGEIPCYKIGQRLRFRLSELNDWMSKQRVPASQSAEGICAEVRL